MSLFDDASLVLTPNGYKASKLYSIKPTSGAGDMTVTRATTATRVNSSNLIESVAINVPRLDYTLGSCPSILVEPARTNLVLRSEEFNNASWSTINVTVTANATTSPSGALTADKFIPTATGVHFVFQTGLPSNAYTFSVFAKAGGETTFSMWLVGGTKKAEFNLSTGTVISTTGASTANIIPYPNGWYRCYMYNATAGTDVRIYGRDGTSFTGNGVDGIFLWGAQAEATTVLNPTSYIPTTTAIVTRNADVISKTGVSSLINSQAGTIFFEGSALANNTTARFIELNDGNTSVITNNVYFRYEPFDNVIAYTVFTGGALQCNISYSLPLTQIALNKMAFVWALNRFEIWVNGSKVAQDTLGITPANLTLSKIIFSDRTGANKFEGNLKSLQLYTTALDNAQLATLTTP